MRIKDKKTKEIKKEETIEADDDRVIANMNIDGMPWKVPGEPVYPESSEQNQPLTRKETLRLTFSALAAALLIGGIFLTIFYLFILFCIHIWL